MQPFEDSRRPTFPGTCRKCCVLRKVMVVVWVLRGVGAVIHEHQMAGKGAADYQHREVLENGCAAAVSIRPR